MQCGSRIPVTHLVGMPSYPTILDRNPPPIHPDHLLYPDFTPAQYMLHHISLPLSTYKKSLILHLINAANLCVPVYWRSITPPTVTEWLQWVDKTADMEKLIHQAKDNPTKFSDTWACWTHFRDSAASTSPSNRPPSPS